MDDKGRHYSVSYYTSNHDETLDVLISGTGPRMKSLWSRPGDSYWETRPTTETSGFPWTGKP